MSDDLLKPGGALGGNLFQGFLRKLADAREPEPGQRIGPFVVRAELGRGGSGVVFLAERADGAFKQQVAVKWLRGDRPVPGGREVLARERELLASLDHPHIARLIDGGECDDGQLWFAMDYVDGQPIDQAAEGHDLPKRLVWIRDLCRGVHHAHSRGLIHGDIKPANVLIDPRGRVRLLDFGIARLQDAALGGSYGLTPEYASPEQRRGEALTTASDVWQLGRLLEELLGPYSVPRDLRAVVDQAMAAEPERRQSSAAALATDIEAWLDGRPVPAHAGGWAYRLAKRMRRHQAASLIGALAVLLLIGATVAANRQLAAERDRAQLAAEQARTALVESEAALARAEQLRDFLIGLFRAAEPDRPRDQLPDTEALLALGAERALDPQAAPAAERLGMLGTIAEIYITLGRRTQASDLLAAARQLAEAEPPPQVQDRVHVLALSGHLAMAEGDFDQAERWLIEGETLARQQPGATDAGALARSRRAWLAYMQGRHQEAYDLLAPLLQAADAGTLDLRKTTRLHLLNTLASASLMRGDLGQSAELRARAVEKARQLDGPESRGYAIQLGNLAVVQLRAGRFEQAQASLEQAISLYDRIFDQPVVLRAAAQANLANLYFYRGDDQQALEQFNLAADEWALAQGRKPEDYEYRYYNLGRFYLQMDRHEAAEQALLKARDLNRQHDSWPASAVAMAEIWSSHSRCRQGRAETAWRDLEAVDPAPISDNPAQLADWQESRAACLHALGRHEEALAAIQASLEQVRWPGHERLISRRQALEAEILATLAR